jgi:hypothetical protein
MKAIEVIGTIEEGGRVRLGLRQGVRGLRGCRITARPAGLRFCRSRLTKPCVVSAVATRAQGETRSPVTCVSSGRLSLKIRLRDIESTFR